MKKIHRFITPYTVVHGKIHITDSELIHQWKNVLKLKNGEELLLANKDTGEVTCIVRELTKKEATLELIQQSKVNKSPQKEVVLYMAILKKENFELVVQKASEIGVSKIVPLITERTIKMGIKHERLIKIATEASELSGRNDIPEITEPMIFKDALKESRHYARRIIFNPSEHTYQTKNEKSLALFVGPEGGFTNEEIKQAEESGCEVVSLGQFILRGETAGIVASYIALN